MKMCQLAKGNANWLIFILYVMKVMKVMKENNKKKIK
jgi:hypothetical protein